ncbi:hypothetical protein PS2_034455 [Malus domestica]
MGDKSESKSTTSGMTSHSQWENPNHPLFLHHSDQPGAILVPQPLMEDNYSTWVQLFHVENEIHDCIQGNMSVSSYFTKLKSLWDERDVLCLIPACNCGTKKEITSYVETQKTMKFLMGLNESYATVRSNTLLLNPLPTVNKAYALVLRHERQAEVSSRKNIQPEAVVFTVKNTNREPESDDNGTRCGKCNKTNHTTKNCRAQLKCTLCGWKGHTFEFCRKRKVAAETESNRYFSSKGNQVTT